MKPLPAPEGITGNTEFERFDNAMRQILRVPKSALPQREDRPKKKPQTKRPPRKG